MAGTWRAEQRTCILWVRVAAFLKVLFLGSFAGSPTPPQDPQQQCGKAARTTFVIFLHLNCYLRVAYCLELQWAQTKKQDIVLTTSRASLFDCTRAIVCDMWLASSCCFSRHAFSWQRRWLPITIACPPQHQCGKSDTPSTSARNLAGRRFGYVFFISAASHPPWNFAGPDHKCRTAVNLNCFSRLPPI